MTDEGVAWERTGVVKRRRVTRLARMGGAIASALWEVEDVTNAE
jgi:hypothetical protein